MLCTVTSAPTLLRSGTVTLSLTLTLALTLALTMAGLAHQVCAEAGFVAAERLEADQGWSLTSEELRRAMTPNPNPNPNPDWRSCDGP